MNSKPKTTKIDFNEMQGLIARSVIIANKENELQFLRNENKHYWKSLVKKYQLDPDISYDINQANNILIWKEKINDKPTT